MATAAAAIIAQTTRKIQHHFFSEDAVRADRAVAFTPSDANEARQFHRMLERGSIKQEGADRYWIDAVAYDIDVHRRHRQTKIVLSIVIIVLAVILLALAVSSGHKVAP